MPRTRQSGDGGLYFDKKRKLWIGVVDNGYTPEGKRKQARVTSKSQSTARSKLLNLKAEIDAHGSPLGNQTVAEWGASWLETVKRKKPQTYRTYLSIYNTWVVPAIGRRNIKDIRPSDLRRIYDNIRAAGRASATALKAHNVMSAMFEAARLERLVKSNVAEDIEAPRTTRSTRDTLGPDETLRILETAARKPGGTKWIVSLYAGIRQGERLGATLDSVDVARGMFTVAWNLVEANYEHGCDGTCAKGRAAGHCSNKMLVIPDGMDVRVLRGRLMLVPPKSGGARTFPLPPALVDALDRHMAELTLQPNPHGLLWPAADGSPVTGREDQEEWRALLVESGVDRPEATTHWARHTAVSDLTAAGVAERVIGEIVGHRSAGITGRYQHVSSQDAIEAMGKLTDRRIRGT